MTDLEICRALRSHLLKHWDVADEWDENQYASDGTRCMVGRFVQISLAAGLYPETSGIFSARVMHGEERPFIIPFGGKEALLKRLDRAIARLEELEAPKFRPQTVVRFRDEYQEA